MMNVQLKIVEEGIKHPIDELRQALQTQLLEDGIFLAPSAELGLKIKFTKEGDQDVVLIQLRETASKAKLGEKLIPYLNYRWIKDVSAEAHTLLAGVVA
jgi:hypothetical protein